MAIAGKTYSAYANLYKITKAVLLKTAFENMDRLLVLVAGVLLEVRVGHQLRHRDGEQDIGGAHIGGFEEPGRQEYTHADHVFSSPAFPPELFLTLFEHGRR